MLNCAKEDLHLKRKLFQKLKNTDDDSKQCLEKVDKTMETKCTAFIAYSATHKTNDDVLPSYGSAKFSSSSSTKTRHIQQDLSVTLGPFFNPCLNMICEH